MNSWICSHCKEANDGNFTQCWNCGTHADGSAPVRPFQHEASAPWRQPPRLLQCLRCPDTRMESIGHKRFHEGSQAMPFLLGDLGELLVNREEFELHACPSCGKVELFLSNLPR